MYVYIHTYMLFVRISNVVFLCSPVKLEGLRPHGPQATKAQQVSKHH